MNARGSGPSARRTAATAALAFLCGCSAGSRSAGPPTEPQSAKAAPPDADTSPLSQPPPQMQPSYPLPGAGDSAPDDLAAQWARFESEERRLDLALAGDAMTLSTGDRCAVVCKSLASMRTSAVHVCKLADEGRCKAAETRVRKAEERAKDACPQCATPT